ncbi:hypothetical protein DFH08DRAFT_822894 [Mycena albidolilacea]|uniref:PHD-type domain-containing protein n=1 Tax=Mycena albidolilacea TaxID=1033008 RepID=A0AAD6Z782_9AGAR|nr:hypothetical protein DFH08DRAFT_822894 [Mycena albidolilacea]
MVECGNFEPYAHEFQTETKSIYPGTLSLHSYRLNFVGERVAILALPLVWTEPDSAIGRITLDASHSDDKCWPLHTARRRLLGSSRAQKEQQQQRRNIGFGEGGELLNGTTTAHGSRNGLAQNALGNGHGSTSTVPQKRKHGMSAGVGGSKVRRDGDGGGTRERRRRKVMSLDMLMNFADRAGGGGWASDEIRCCRGSSVDDRFSVACDVCERWCHAACFAISKDSVPEEWKC